MRFLSGIFVSIFIGLFTLAASAHAGIFQQTPTPAPPVGIPSIAAGFGFVLAEPRLGAFNLGQVSSGDPIVVVGVNETLDWYYIRTQELIYGWIQAETTQLAPDRMSQLVILPAPDPGNFGGRRNVALGCGQVELGYTSAPIYLLWRMGAATREQVEQIADSTTFTIRLNDLELIGAPNYPENRLTPERYGDLVGITWRFPLGVLPPGTYTISHDYTLNTELDESVEVGLDGQSSLPSGTSICQIVVAPPTDFTAAPIPTERMTTDENLLAETFADNTRDWQPSPTFFAEAEGGLSVENGVMTLEVASLPIMQSDIFLHTVLPEKTPYLDLAAQVDVLSRTPEGAFTADLWLRAAENATSGYVFRLNPNTQEYSLSLRLNDSWLDDLIPPTQSDLINPTESNQLGAVILGSQLDLYINGTLVNSVRDTRIAGGTILLSVTAYEGEALPAIAAFDNLMLSNEIGLVFAEVAQALTSTPRPTDTATPTVTPIPTDTPVPTHTPTPTNTATYTATFTATPSATQTPSLTSTLPPSLTYTASPTATLTSTPTATFTPTATLTPTPVVIANVAVAQGGIEVFPLPDRASGRLFAAVRTDFAPYIAGRTADSQWIYLYYLEGDTLVGAWAFTRQLNITPEQVATLSIIDPQNPPPVPILPFTEQAERPGR